MTSPNRSDRVTFGMRNNQGHITITCLVDGTPWPDPSGVFEPLADLDSDERATLLAALALQLIAEGKLPYPWPAKMGIDGAMVRSFAAARANLIAKTGDKYIASPLLYADDKPPMHVMAAVVDEAGHTRILDPTAMPQPTSVPTTIDEVRALLTEASRLAASLRAITEALQGFNSQPGRPDWWRQIQKDGSKSMSHAAIVAGNLESTIDNSIDEVRRWTEPGGAGYEAIEENAQARGDKKEDP